MGAEMKLVRVVALVALGSVACVPFVQPQEGLRARVRISAEGLARDATYAGVDIGYEPSCRTVSRFELVPVSEGASANVDRLAGSSASASAFAPGIDGSTSMVPKAFAREVWVEAGRKVRISVYASNLPWQLYRTVVFVPSDGEDYELRLTKRTLTLTRHNHEDASTTSTPVSTARSRCQPTMAEASPP